MNDRHSAHAKLIPLVAPDGRLTEALAPIWLLAFAKVGEKVGLSIARREQLKDECLASLRSWVDRPEGRERRAVLQQWLVRLRLDLSMEELLLVLIQADRALRQAGWQLGLPAPDWLALSELVSDYFEALLEEASAGWQGLLAQNHQLKDELAYFHRLASSLESGQNLDEHLGLAVRETARLLHCEFCAILLPREDARDVLVIRSAVAPRILSRALEGMTFPLAENGLIAQVFLTGAPASTYQPLDDLEITMRRRQTLESLGFSQLMAYPLQTHGRVLGVLCVANRLDDQPWQALEEEWLSTVAAQLSASIRLSQLYGTQETGEAELAQALALALSLHDEALERHGRAVGALARGIGAALGLAGSRLELLELAGWLHDLGMLRVPDAIRHRPGPLWPAEWAIVRQHPEAACRALEPLKPLAALLPAIRHHHERWDGLGYPDGLKGQAIPLDARILAVADAYHAMITPRPYRETLSPEAAIAELRAGAGSQFDSVAVQALQEALRREDETMAEVLFPAPEPEAAEAVSPDPAAGLLAQAPRLVTMMAELVGASDGDSLFGRFWEILGANVAFAAGAVWRPGEGGKLRVVAASGMELALGGEPIVDGGLESYAAACRVPVSVPDWRAESRFDLPYLLMNERLRNALALPLVSAERLLGVLTIYRRETGAFTSEEQTVLELAAAMLAHGLAAQDLQARHQDLLAADALTGLGSHRSFMERLAAEIKRVERFELPLSCLLFDLDGFGAYNEAHGHGLGDEVLRQVADLIEGQVRPADWVARWTGDAFAVILPECGTQEAMGLGEQLRLTVAASQFPSRRAGGARLTVSVGVTTHQPGGSRADLVADMQLALDQARREGVSRLVFHAGRREAAEK